MRKKTVIRALIISGVVIIVLFVISIGTAPLNRIRQLENLVKEDTVFIEQYDSAYNHAELSGLIREKAYKAALVKLSEGDSIQMVINLMDSTVCLNIKGITIHQAKADYVDIDPLLKKLPAEIYYRLFSQPIRILKQNATIVKEPVVVRHAPKDTLEAALNAYLPDTLMQNPAFFHAELDHGLDLILEQNTDPAFYDQKTHMMFSLQRELGYFKKSISNFALFRKQDYRPEIIIRIPVGDLRAIYRALPRQPYVIIYY